MRRRLRQLLLSVLALVAFAWVVWLVGANAALAIAPHTLDRREPVKLSFRAWTIVPGIVHVRDLQLRAEDRWTQWGLDVGSATAHVDIGALFHRRFRATKVDADGVHMRLRVKRTPEQLAEAPEQAYPEISGFEGPPLRDDARFQFGRPLEHPWTLDMENVRARTQELWVEGEHFEGAALATGEFELTFDRSVEVGSAELTVERGSLRHRGDQVAQALKGHARARLDPFNPREVRDGAVLDQLSVQTTVEGSGPPDVKDADFLANVSIARGVLQQGTKVRAAIPRLSQRMGAVNVRGALRAAASVGPREQISWSATGSNLRASLPAQGLAVDIARANASATSRGARLRKLGLPSNARVSVPDARMTDLRTLNALIPDPLDLDIRQGSGRVSANLRVDLRKKAASGTVQLRTRGLALRHEGRTLRGQVAVDVKVANAGAKLDSVVLGPTRVKLSNMTVAQRGNSSAPFDGVVALSGATIHPRRKEVLKAHVDADFVNAKPLFRAMVDELPVPAWTRGPLTPNNVSAEADLVLGRSLVRVDRLEGRVGRAEVRGGMALEGGREQALAEISLGPSRIGVEREGDRTQVKLFARRAWYDQRVAALH